MHTVFYIQNGANELRHCHGKLLKVCVCCRRFSAEVILEESGFHRVVFVDVKEWRQELNCSRRAPGYFSLIGEKASPTARDISEVARALNRRCYLYNGNSGLIWCLSSSPSFSVGFSFQDEAMDVARSAPQGTHYHADVIYLLP